MRFCFDRLSRFCFLDPSKASLTNAMFWCGLLLALFGAFDATFAQDGPKAIDEVFEKQVRPLLISKCYECHSQSTEQNGGLSMDSLEGMLKGGDSGPALIVESPENSLILRAIRYRDPKLLMPPENRMSASEVRILEDWIALGAKASVDFQKIPEGIPQDGKPGALATQRSALGVEQAREHWAYRPLVRSEVPANGQSNPIDAFLARGSESLQVEPSRLVDERTWIRRLAIDLHGMNPSAESIDSALKLFQTNDDSQWDSIRSRLVDEYLASARYGERFARHWMDVVRYAESLTLRGFVFPDVWRYRNYLIEAYNQDRPFDGVIAEQIAGDLMNRQSPHGRTIEELQRRLVATTFWAIGDHNYEEQDKKQLEMDAVDEQIEVFGRTFLAQTLGCARCHDHKFDPIPTADYYALAGILKSSVSMDHENVSKWIRQPLPMSDQEQQKFDGLAKRLQEVKKELSELKDRKKQGNQSATVVSSQEVSGVVVDDRKAKKIGSWKESNSVKVYIDEGYLHDENKDRGSKSVTFDPGSLASGLYTVRMSYAHGENRSSKTQVRVFNADGETLVVVNQKTPPAEDGLWFNLGKYRFEKDGAAFVIVSNEQADGHVIADSVQFMPDLEDSAKKDSAKKEPQAESKSSAKNVDQQHESMIKQIAILENLQTEIQKELDLRPMAQTLRPADSPSDIPIHVRGSVHRLGPVVERGFLSCINSHEPELNRRIRVQAADNGRLELAQWTIAPENPLTARVYVNRIWYHMMGRGIVPTVDNFGTTGSPPSDPQLLDWLASEFIAQDWSTKWLVQTIATSKAYRRSIAASPDSLEKDPENQVFARGLLRRLDSESLRDSMLQASGELQVGGSVGSTIRPGTKEDYRYEHQADLRSVYLPWFRNALPPLIREFDGANPSFSISERNRSTVATQALAMMNHPWVRQRASALVASLNLPPSDPRDPAQLDEAIESIFRKALGRNPEATEQPWARSVVENGGLEELAHQLLASIDFRYAP
ncbi:MAG: DUF1553 domain-containing protein [Planctomycetota bacterium]|nr:DUF1553 domain-containing protein [Planctomycetota bacterium]